MKLVINGNLVGDLNHSETVRGKQIHEINVPMEIAIVVDPMDDRTKTEAFIETAYAHWFKGPGGRVCAYVYEGAWAVMAEGAKKPARTGITKEEAVEQAYAMAWTGANAIA